MDDLAEAEQIPDKGVSARLLHGSQVESLGVGKVVLYRVEGGERVERWPVDARELLGTGEWTVEAPEE